jgi:hypothetical protein
MILPIMAAEPSLCFRQLGQDYSAKCQESIYDQEISTDQFNYGFYPSRYFNAAQFFVDENVELSVVKIRLANSLIASLLLSTGFCLAMRKSANSVLTWLALSTPVCLYFIASVNTSSWTLVGTTSFVLFLLTAVDRSAKRSSRIISASMSLIMVYFVESSRREGKYVLLILGTVIFLQEIISRNIFKRWSKIPVALFLLFILYRLYNYASIVNGSFDIFNDSRTVEIDGKLVKSSSLLVSNVLNLHHFISGFFGSWGLGWFDFQIPRITYMLTTVNFIVITFFIFKNSKLTDGFWFIFLFLVMVLGILFSNQQLLSKIGTFVQPRYFLPYFLGALVLSVSRVKTAFHGYLAAFLMFTSSLVYAISLRQTIRRYTSGTRLDLRDTLNNSKEWWWNFGPNPEVIWLIGTISFCALALLIVRLHVNSEDYRVVFKK